MCPDLNALRRGLPLASLPRLAGLGAFWPRLVNPPASKAEINTNVVPRIFAASPRGRAPLKRSLEVSLLAFHQDFPKTRGADVTGTVGQRNPKIARDEFFVFEAKEHREAGLH